MILVISYRKYICINPTLIYLAKYIEQSSSFKENWQNMKFSLQQFKCLYSLQALTPLAPGFAHNIHSCKED